MTLEELMVVSAHQCSVCDDANRVLIEFTPTVPHCGMSTVIGVSAHIQVYKTERSPQDFRCGSVCYEPYLTDSRSISASSQARIRAKMNVRPC